MSIYAIVLTGKELSTLHSRKGETLVFVTIEAAQKAIHMECLDEVYSSVKIIVIGSEEVKSEDVGEGSKSENA